MHREHALELLERGALRPVDLAARVAADAAAHGAHPLLERPRVGFAPGGDLRARSVDDGCVGTRQAFLVVRAGHGERQGRRSAAAPCGR